MNLLDLDMSEMRTLCEQYRQPAFRAGQLFGWLYRGVDFDEMSNIPKTFTDALRSDGRRAQSVSIIKRLQSSDGTRKYLFSLEDGNVVEGVLMRYKYGATVCVSTQVGCRMGCAFCASGIGGLVRNLTAGEIAGQVIAANADLSEDGARAIVNVVLMGSGEPLDNYDNVVKFLRLINDKDGLNVSRRNISLSTCGLVDRIKLLADDGCDVNLTISLHAPDDEIRRRIMPVANKYSVAEVVAAAREYFQKTGRRVYFEYALIRDVNDSLECADKLARLVRGMSAHINLIRLNDVAEKPLKSPSKERIKAFIDRLSQTCSVTLRRSMGADIEGACGQLRRGYIGEGTCSKEE